LRGHKQGRDALDRARSSKSRGRKRESQRKQARGGFKGKGKEEAVEKRSFPCPRQAISQGNSSSRDGVGEGLEEKL
jgi:hypothetical protein